MVEQRLIARQRGPGRETSPTRPSLDFLGDATAEDLVPSAVDIPAGISFCILIPTDVIRTVGLMDPVFGRGYCEETDWTLRSQELGYRIALAPSVFVYHRGQGSNVAAGIIASGYSSVPADERIVDLAVPVVQEQVEGFRNSEILDLLQNSALRSIMTKAAREFGDTGSRSAWLVKSSPHGRTPGPVLSPVHSIPSPNCFRGFRNGVRPAPGHDENPLQSIIDFFGQVGAQCSWPTSAPWPRSWRRPPSRPGSLFAPTSGTRFMSERTHA